MTLIISLSGLEKILPKNYTVEDEESTVIEHITHYVRTGTRNNKIVPYVFKNIVASDNSGITEITDINGKTIYLLSANDGKHIYEHYVIDDKLIAVGLVD